MTGVGNCVSLRIRCLSLFKKELQGLVIVLSYKINKLSLNLVSLLDHMNQSYKGWYLMIGLQFLWIETFDISFKYAKQEVEFPNDGELLQQTFRFEYEFYDFVRQYYLCYMKIYVNYMIG